METRVQSNLHKILTPNRYVNQRGLDGAYDFHLRVFDLGQLRSDVEDVEVGGGDSVSPIIKRTLIT